MNKPETQTGKSEKQLEKLEKKLNKLERQLEKRDTQSEKPEKKLDINGGLRKFNLWMDEFILEAAKPFALLGFAMGTIDIFLRGDIATQVWFNVPWSAVQAVSIDGLFFSVWYKLFSARWTKKTWLGNIGLFLAGLVLAGMVIVTNGITSLQQLWNLPDSQSAMERIGIPVELFTLVRATLIVVVAVLIAFVYYRKYEANAESSAGNSSLQSVQIQLQPGIPPVQTGVQNGNTGMQPVQNGVQTGILGMHSVQPGNSTQANEIPPEQSVVRTGNTEFQIEQTRVRTEQTGIQSEQSTIRTGIQSVRDGNFVIRDEQPENAVVIREVRDELPQLPPRSTRLTKEGLLEKWASSDGKLNVSELATEYGIAKTTLYGWLKGIKERACLVPAR
jgi:hypothetical protein